MSADEALSVDAIDSELAGCCQGDVVDFQTFSWHVDTRRPLTEVSAEAEDSSGHAIVVSESDHMVVVTQTCDVVRSCADRPFVQLSPLVELEESVAREAARGMRPRYAAVPAMGDRAFADLDRIMTVEKSLVASASQRPGCTDDGQRRRFAASVGRKFGRIAFPDDLELSLRGLTSRIKSKHDKDSPEGKALSALEEIRVTASPSWDAGAIDVFLSFCPATLTDAVNVMTEDDWDSLIDDWIGRASPTGVVARIDGAMVPLEELTALEYVDSDRLDLDHLST